jgi:VWFA-related protein
MQDFTADTTDLGKGIEKLSNGGGTALFDAVSSACWKLAKYPDHERVARVLVILSDGEDNSSHSSLKQTIQVAERTGVTIYAISTREEIRDKTDADKVLEALAEQSGGEAMFPGDLLTLGKSFDKLRDVIRGRYFIAYTPADFQPNGSYRTIKVAAEKNGKRLQIRSRKGYHARLEAVHN